MEKIEHATPPFFLIDDWVDSLPPASEMNPRESAKTRPFPPVIGCHLVCVF